MKFLSCGEISHKPQCVVDMKTTPSANGNLKELQETMISKSALLELLLDFKRNCHQRMRGGGDSSIIQQSNCEEVYSIKFSGSAVLISSTERETTSKSPPPKRCDISMKSDKNMDTKNCKRDDESKICQTPDKTPKQMGKKKEKPTGEQPVYNEERNLGF